MHNVCEISRSCDDEIQEVVSQWLNLFTRDTTSAVITGCVILVCNLPAHNQNSSSSSVIIPVT
jgi:hypothetical protein